MANSVIKSNFSAGEIAPALWGRTDLQKFASGCATLRNAFVSYKGGAMSRGGTAFVGQCKQSASAASIPPRDIRFKFNLFQSYVLEFGELYMRVKANGGYVTESAFAITAASQANPCVLQLPGNNYAAGDWFFIGGISGMFQLNQRTFVVASVVGNAVTITDTFGNPVDSRQFGAYVSGGTAARIYTLASPYHAVDLPWLKFTQSADTMSLTCVNQQTNVDYPPQDLVRNAANSWTLTPTVFASSIAAPTGTTATAQTAGSVGYSYVVTAVAANGEESVASNIGNAASVNLSTTAAAITVSWTAVTGATGYNIYRAAPSYNNTVPVGVLYGFVGSTNGNASTTWQESNIIPDFTTVPPLHNNPFPSTANYPGVVAYFQQRRAYAMTINAPGTYNMSEPGAFKNFDAAIPPIASDAIVGSPWAEQVNGIQWLVPMPGGLIVGTGENVWQVSGTGGAGSPITPSQQNAQAQDSVGFSPTVPPIRIGSDFVYVPALGSKVRSANYNFYVNMYSGSDVTVLSSHLFDNYQITQWVWAREPYNVVWSVRNDGRMLSWTTLKEQEISGWGRSDTQGLAVSVATASEPPVDAVYWIVKRYIKGVKQWAYFSERMDPRLWQNVEQSWAVDAGLSLTQPQPAANLSVDTATGTAVNFNADAAVFSAVNIGSVIRVGGGIATITSVPNPQVAVCNITTPITATIPNDPDNMPVPAAIGQWTMTAPVSSLTNLGHLEGMTVSILADGNVVPPQKVVGGTITLPNPATSIVVGLPFAAEIQSMNLDIPGEETVQGKRKKIVAVTVRMNKSRGFSVGVDQPNASAQQNQAEPVWTDMREFKRSNAIGAGNAIPLFTGDGRIIVDSDWGLPGQVAVQQNNPLPMEVTAFIPEVVVGDTSG